jgi:hypothetical protein
VEELKTAWKTYHRERLLNFLKKHNINFHEDPGLTFQQNAYNISKAGYYAALITNK